MNARERMLAVAAGSIVALVVGRSLLTSWYFKPLAARDAQIAAMVNQVENREFELLRAEMAQAELDSWRAAALPANISLAQTLYQESLRRLLEESGIEKPTIATASPTERAGESTKLAYTVRARASIESIGRLLYALERQPVLHRIGRVGIRPIVEQDRLAGFDLTLLVEAMSLPDAKQTDRLPNEEDASPPWRKRDDRPLETFSLAWTKNIFQPTRWQRKESPPPPVARPSRPDERSQFRVSALVEENGRALVWFASTRDTTRKILAVGELLEIGGMTARVASIAPGEVHLEVDGAEGVVKLGRTLDTWRRTFVEPRDSASPAQKESAESGEAGEAGEAGAENTDTAKMSEVTASTPEVPDPSQPEADISPVPIEGGRVVEGSENVPPKEAVQSSPQPAAENGDSAEGDSGT